MTDKDQAEWDEFVEQHGRIIGYRVGGPDGFFIPSVGTARDVEVIQRSFDVFGKAPPVWVYGPRSDT